MMKAEPLTFIEHYGVLDAVPIALLVLCNIIQKSYGISKF